MKNVKRFVKHLTEYQEIPKQKQKTDKPKGPTLMRRTSTCSGG